MHKNSIRLSCQENILLCFHKKRRRFENSITRKNGPRGHDECEGISMSQRGSACYGGDQHVTEKSACHGGDKHVTGGISKSQRESARHRGSFGHRWLIQNAAVEYIVTGLYMCMHAKRHRPLQNSSLQRFIHAPAAKEDSKTLAKSWKASFSSTSKPPALPQDMQIQPLCLRKPSHSTPILISCFSLCPLRHKGELPVFVYLPFPGLALARPCTHPQPFLNKIAVTVTSHLPPNHFSLVEGFTAQMQGEMLRGNQHVTTTATLF
eukprot:1146309-Pelagomonas_calceolata.AAC.4